MKKAYQYRYMNNDKWPNDINDPSKTISYEKIVTGSIFADKTPIYQLGIQSLPGTKFYLNGGVDPIIIGSTGIYELDLHDKATISSLRFAADSVKTIQNGFDNNTSFLIVDIIYEGEEE